MDTVQIANVLGFLAAGIGIFMFLPQTIRIWKTKDTKAISLASFLLLALSSIIWTTYGILLSAPPIILVNTVLAILSAYIVLMKLKYK